MLLGIQGATEVGVRVEYYDAQEANAFATGGYPATLTQVAGHVIQIPISEFLTYSLFNLKEYKPSTHGSFPVIAKKIKTADSELSEWVEKDGGSLFVKSDCEGLDSSVTRRLGDAVGMAVANRIHGLTDADWDFIPEKAGKGGQKTLDWHVASDGVNHIELETKGCFNSKSASLEGLFVHKTRIKGKKAEAAKDDYHRGKALRYGAIVAIDKQPGSTMYCRLVDPDGSQMERDPMSERLLHRMRWAADIISTISPLSSFAVALNNRLTALEGLPNPFLLENIDLKRGDDTILDLKPRTERSYSPFFETRTTVSQEPLGGTVTRYDSRHLLFLGIHADWITALTRQNFGSVTRLEFKPSTSKTRIHCVMTWPQFRRNRLSGKIENPGDPNNSQFAQFWLPAVIHTSSGGMSFGLANLPE